MKQQQEERTAGIYHWWIHSWHMSCTCSVGSISPPTNQYETPTRIDRSNPCTYWFCLFILTNQTIMWHNINININININSNSNSNKLIVEHAAAAVLLEFVVHFLSTILRERLPDNRLDAEGQDGGMLCMSGWIINTCIYCSSYWSWWYYCCCIHDVMQFSVYNISSHVLAWNHSSFFCIAS